MNVEAVVYNSGNDPPIAEFGRLRSAPWPVLPETATEMAAPTLVEPQHAPSLWLLVECGWKPGESWWKRTTVDCSFRPQVLPLPEQRGGVFLGMRKSIDPMECTLPRRKGSGLPTPLLIVSMSFRPVIPRSGCSPAEPAFASPTNSDFPVVRDACQCLRRSRPPPRHVALDTEEPSHGRRRGHGAAEPQPKRFAKSSRRSDGRRTTTTGRARYRGSKAGHHRSGWRLIKR